uniref:Uncharacterized protein n=1 Tax=Candidatus Methanogaster sp. ANME-2c ERB4 TaxID=2759911 RepID=A0A7G9YDP1_9EURY|nr:hypothetical protein MFHEKKGA_00018 [Methanosarcinales archaeon ANME-2c ERB4]
MSHLPDACADYTSIQAEAAAGEREAIILVSEQNTDLLLMDDRNGRSATMVYGINVMGTPEFLGI